MEIRLRSNGAVMFESELRAYLLANGGPSYDELTPEVMEAIGVDPVFEGRQPETGRYQFVARQGVIQTDNGDWYSNYVAIDMSPEACVSLDNQQASNVRRDRNKLLAESDWTQLSDSPPDASVWATYRQALRDITKQPGFPWQVTWPNPPA